MEISYETKHKWQRGESTQWGELGLLPSAAATPYWCAVCGLAFTHFYNQERNIYKAIAEAGIDNSVCIPQDGREHGI